MNLDRWMKVLEISIWAFMLSLVVIFLGGLAIAWRFSWILGAGVSLFAISLAGMAVGMVKGLGAAIKEGKEAVDRERASREDSD